jgi:TniQ
MWDLDGSTPKFLITRQIQDEESLRGYVARVAHCNAASAFVQPWLGSFSEATRWIPVLSNLTGISSDDLRAHGSIEPVQGSTTPMVRFGNAVLPGNQVWQSRRNVCLQCLANDGISRGYWDLKMYSVCHKHGIRLVSKCSNCKQVLRWNVRLQDVCGCGLPISELKPSTARSCTQKEISALVALSFNQTINCDDSTQLIVNGHRSFSLNWTLLLIEFVRYVLLPGFWKAFRTDEMNLDDSELESLIVPMLWDKEYREMLCEAIFVHASKNPAKLQKALSPGNGPATVQNFLGGFLRDIPFHRSLWKQHWSTPTHKVKPIRAVKRRSKSTVRPQPRGQI